MTIRLARLLIVFGLIALGASPARADTYMLDKNHTEVRYSWNHLGVSRQSGSFTDVQGTVTFDQAAPQATVADITIAIGSISTGVPELDTVLARSGDFFDLGRFPKATFRSTLVELTGDKTARMTGDLTINGITRPVTLDVTWNFSGDHPLGSINPIYTGIYVSGFSATTQLLRSDWGLTRSIPYISDEIQITIETEMHRQAVSPVEAPLGVPEPEVPKRP